LAELNLHGYLKRVLAMSRRPNRWQCLSGSADRFRRTLAIASLVVSFLGAAEAIAALQIRDYLTSGDGLITYDTDTGLEWLDVTETLGISYDTMETRLADTADPLYGWSHAAARDLNALFVSANIDVINVLSAPSDADVDALIKLVGETLKHDSHHGTIGWTSDPVVAPAPYTWWVLGAVASSASDGTTLATDSSVFPGAGYAWDKSRTHWATGHWLIRPASDDGVVPEPTSVFVWALLVVTAAPIVARRRLLVTR
jgi:hypothetical protein